MNSRPIYVRPMPDLHDAKFVSSVGSWARKSVNYLKPTPEVNRKLLPNEISPSKHVIVVFLDSRQAFLLHGYDDPNFVYEERELQYFGDQCRCRGTVQCQPAQPGAI